MICIRLLRLQEKLDIFNGIFFSWGALILIGAAAIATTILSIGFLKSPNHSVPGFASGGLTEVPPPGASPLRKTAPPAKEVPPSLSDQWTALMMEGKFEEVASMSQSAESAFPGSRIPRLFRIQALVQLKRVREAEETVRMALKLLPDDPETLLTAGVFQQAMGNTLLAEKLFLKTLAVDPGLLGGYRGLVAVYLKSGLNQPAMEVAERGIRKFPGDVPLLKMLGQAAFRAGDWHKGSIFLESALNKLGKKDAAVSLMLAKCLKEIPERKKESGDCLREAYENASETPEILNEYALFLAENHQPREAETLLPALLKTSKRAPFALDTAGLVYLRSGKPSDAEMAFKEASEAEPANPYICLHQALACERLNKAEEARMLLDKSRELCWKDAAVIASLEEELKRLRLELN